MLFKILQADHVLNFSIDSVFSETFDFNHFIEVLRDDIKIAESLPPEFAALKPLVKAPVSWSKVWEFTVEIKH